MKSCRWKKIVLRSFVCFLALGALSSQAQTSNATVQFGTKRGKTIEGLSIDFDDALNKFICLCQDGKYRDKITHFVRFKGAEYYMDVFMEGMRVYIRCMPDSFVPKAWTPKVYKDFMGNEPAADIFLECKAVDDFS